MYASQVCKIDGTDGSWKSNVLFFLLYLFDLDTERCELFCLSVRWVSKKFMFYAYNHSLRLFSFRSRIVNTLYSARENENINTYVPVWTYFFR